MLLRSSWQLAQLFQAVLARVLTFLGAAPSPAVLAVASAAVLTPAPRLGPSGEKPRQNTPPRSPAPPVTLIHLHVPKSAGTSLRGALAANFGPGEKIAIRPADFDATIDRMTAVQRAGLRMIFGHLPHGVGARLDQPVIYLCVLRQPGPRLLSFYRYIRRQADHPLHRLLNERDMSFGEYLTFCLDHPTMRLEVDNGQMRRLAGRLAQDSLGHEHDIFRLALEHAFAPDMVLGLTERFTAFLDNLVAMGLIRSHSEARENAAPETASFEEARAALTPEQAAILSRFTEWDQKLYDICAIYLFGLDPQEGH